MALTLDEIWACLCGEADDATRLRFLEELDTDGSLASQVANGGVERARFMLASDEMRMPAEPIDYVQRIRRRDD